LSPDCDTAKARSTQECRRFAGLLAGTSVGFDWGGDGARTMTLVYNLPGPTRSTALRRHRRLRLYYRRLRHDRADRHNIVLLRSAPASACVSAQYRLSSNTRRARPGTHSDRRLFRKTGCPVLRSECAQEGGASKAGTVWLRIHVNARRAGVFSPAVADVIHGKCDTKSFSRGVLIHDLNRSCIWRSVFCSMLFGLMIVPLVHNRAVGLTTRRMEARRRCRWPRSRPTGSAARGIRDVGRGGSR